MNTGARPPSRTAALRRPAALGLVAVVLAGAGLVDRAASTTAPPSVVVPAAEAAAAGAESSSWYCVGGGASGSPAPATVYLTNTTAAAVSGTVTVVNGVGSSASTRVSVAAGSQQLVDPGRLEAGDWAATEIDLSGGGVVASQAVAGAWGWSVAPCASSTQGTWYFPSGATLSGDAQDITLFNPTSTPSVVDMTFVTPDGVTQPAPFQGIVLAPGRLVVEPIGAYVQAERSVSTIVTAGSGRVVAGQLQTLTGPRNGLTLQLGSPAPERRWDIPRSVDLTGGTTSFSIFNPSSTPQRVTVAVRLPSGPVTPFADVVAPRATWTLTTSRATRIPADLDFTLTVLDHDGGGVVVARTTQATPAAASPRTGTSGAAVPASVSGAPARRWVVPAPGAGTIGAVSGATPYALCIASAGPGTATVAVGVLGAGGVTPLATVPAFRLGPGVFTVVPQASLAPAGLHPLVVTATGPVAVVEEAIPAGMPGVVALSGIPF